MPIDGIGVGGLFRFLGWFLFEIVIEIFIRGSGYILCRPFRKVSVDSAAALFVGLLAWMIIIVIGVVVSGWISGPLEIDSCLDSGGRYNYENHSCEYNQ